MFGFDIAEVTDTLERLVKLHGENQRRNMVEAAFLYSITNKALQKNSTYNIDDIAADVENITNEYLRLNPCT